MYAKLILPFVFCLALAEAAKLNGVFQEEGTIRPGQNCVYDEQCIGGAERRAFCGVFGMGHFCFCQQEDYIENAASTDCIPKKHMNETCEEWVQCQIGGDDGDFGCFPSKEDETVKICQCSTSGVAAPDYHFCFKTAGKVGDVCVLNGQCTANLGELSHCDGILCRCKQGAQPNLDGTACVPI